MKQVVLVDGLRTPIGKHGGVFRDLTAQYLMAQVFTALLDRVGLDPKLVDEVIVGCVGQDSDAVNIGRVSALMAGLPARTPGYTVHRNCTSGMMSISAAYQAIQSGDGDVFLCGGTESMSTAPYVVRGARWGLKLRHTEFIDSVWEALTDPVCGQVMGLTAENLATMYAISREVQDRFAVDSHQKAARAREAKFPKEIVPVRVRRRVAGKTVCEDVVQDECVNPSFDLEQAAAYPTIFKREGGTVTPANACPLSDGAAAILVMSADKAASLGLRWRATVRGYAYAGVPPDIMGLGPAYAVPKALSRADLRLTDVDLIELNEAFAAQALAVGIELQDQGWDWDRVNVHGGAIALGHPVGCTGTRFLVTLLNAMEDRDVSLGMATACVGGGMGGAMVLERE